MNSLPAVVSHDSISVDPFLPSRVCVWFNITTMVYFKCSWQIRLCLTESHIFCDLWRASVAHVFLSYCHHTSTQVSRCHSSLRRNCHDDHVWKSVSCLSFHFFYIYSFSLRIKWWLLLLFSLPFVTWKWLIQTGLSLSLSSFKCPTLILDLSPGSFNVFYPALKHGLSGGKHKQLKNWKAASIFNKIDKKASNKIYSVSSNSYSTGAGGNNTDTCHAGSFGSGNNNARRSTANTNGQSFAGSSSDNNFACNNVQHDQPASNNILREHNCLIIGGGPCGLRTAIELQLLGASNVVVVEKRDRYSRNNVLHLWPFVIADLKQMAGKKFYGKFCAGEYLSAVRRFFSLPSIHSFPRLLPAKSMYPHTHHQSSLPVREKKQKIQPNPHSDHSLP